MKSHLVRGLAWFGMVSCAIVGASSVTACGAAFTEDTGDGGSSGEPGAITADSSDEGNGLEGSLVDATAPDGATHADATSDGGADGTTAIDVTRSATA